MLRSTFLDWLILVKTEASPYLTVAQYALPRLQNQLRAGDTEVIETGTCMTHWNKMPLPESIIDSGYKLQTPPVGFAAVRSTSRRRAWAGTFPPRLFGNHRALFRNKHGIAGS